VAVVLLALDPAGTVLREWRVAVVLLALGPGELLQED